MNQYFPSVAKAFDYSAVNDDTYHDTHRSERTPSQVRAALVGVAPTNTSQDPVVVFFPSGNYNQIQELGRYKNLSVAMGILSSINHPDNAFQIPEYKIFSLESGAEIHSH